MGRHTVSSDHPHTVYICAIHYTRTCIYVYVWHRVVCVARMMYGAPDIPKLRATLATSRRRHSLSRDWNICKYSQDHQHMMFRKKHQEKRTGTDKTETFLEHLQISGVASAHLESLDQTQQQVELVGDIGMIV